MGQPVSAFYVSHQDAKTEGLAVGKPREAPRIPALGPASPQVPERPDPDPGPAPQDLRTAHGDAETGSQVDLMTFGAAPPLPYGGTGPLGQGGRNNPPGLLHMLALNVKNAVTSFLSRDPGCHEPPCWAQTHCARPATSRRTRDPSAPQGALG